MVLVALQRQQTPTETKAALVGHLLLVLYFARGGLLLEALAVAQELPPLDLLALGLTVFPKRLPHTMHQEEMARQPALLLVLLAV